MPPYKYHANRPIKKASINFPKSFAKRPITPLIVAVAQSINGHFIMIVTIRAIMISSITVLYYPWTKYSITKNRKFTVISVLTYYLQKINQQMLFNFV
jgi:hypothetical protein